MAVWNVLSNGIAPSNAQIGDTIRTAAGNYTIVAPGTSGATYNPASGRWSIKDTSPEYMVDAKSIVQDNNEAMSNAAQSANAISQMSSAQQYAFNAEEAQKTREWQERMSNTSHQREVQDLLAAGLNPVLSSTLGGASTPSGATASGSSYSGQKSDVDTSLLSIMSSMLPALLGSQTQKDIAKIQAETALQTARISSAASMYSADSSKSASKYMADITSEGQSALNKALNSILSGSGAEVISGLSESISEILDLFKKPSFFDNTTIKPNSYTTGGHRR